MTSQDLQILENQLLRSQKETTDQLIEGTDQYYYYSFMKILNNNGYNLTEKQQNDLTNYIKLNTASSKKIELRSLFLEYDMLSTQKQSEDIEKKQKAILDKINKSLFNFSFDSVIPPPKNNSLIENKNKEKDASNELKQKDLKIDLQTKQYLALAYSENGFQNIKPSLYQYLDIKRLIKSPFQIIQTFINNIGNELIDMTDVPILFDYLINSKDFKFQFTKVHFKKLSLQQMEQIYQLNKNFLEIQIFIDELCLKKFQINLQFIDYSELDQRQKLEIYFKLKEIYIWTNILPKKFETVKESVLFQLLTMGIHINQYDFELFFEFLLNPKYISLIQDWNPQQNQLKVQGLSTIKLIKKYIKKCFEKNEYNRIVDFVPKIFLQRIQAKVKLQQGQDLLDIYDYFSNTEIARMSSKKQITICSSNTMQFKHGEQVKLFVKLQNITQLNVKIFEINTENYYIQKQQQLDSEINLDGLIAFEETNFTYNYPPMQKVIKEFEFETITNTQRGVFIVEFIGNGVSSRAIIKKGKLQLRESITAAGQRFQIIDENFQICLGQKTGIWIDKKFHQIDQKRKEILIPFGQRDQQFNAIIVHENYAEFSKVFIQKENYQLQCAFLIVDEQLLMGTQAKAVILTKLYVNGTEVGLNLLEDQKIVVTSTNDSGVPSTLPFDNVKFEKDRPFEIQFPITSKLKMITIKVSGKIKRMHQENEKKDEILEQSHTILFDNWEGEQRFCNQYLKYDEENGYQIYVLGKNGEPKQGVDVIVTFLIQAINQTIKQNFKTNQEGKVNLGDLNTVSSITSEIRGYGDIQVQQKIWQIQKRSQIQYPNSLTISEGQLITLPYFGFETIDKNLALYEIYGQTIINSLSNIIILEDSHIKFKLDKQGIYELFFIKENFKISINVIQGEIFSESNLIRSQNQIIIDKGQEQIISLQTVEKTKVEEGVKLKGQLCCKLKPIIFIYATTFINKEFEQQVGQIQQLINKRDPEKINLNLPNSIFQSNKELSDEQKYVLNRKSQERYIGNTLEKPQILLQKQYVRETQTEDEKLEKGHNYKETQKKAQEEAASGSKQSQVSNSKKFQQKIQTFQDFLKYPAQLYSNIQIDQQNQFEIIIPSIYSTAVILIFNNHSFQQITLPLYNVKIETRNLAHFLTLEKNKFYSINRNSCVLEGKVPFQVQDITSTEIKLIDSLDKLFTILKELRRAEGGDVDLTNFQKWEFLVKWNQKQFEEKHTLYNEHQSDELNLFIYFKDFPYFKAFTENYIRNKIEKSFVDLFLLSDDQKLRTYCSMTKIKELNALEQTLLIYYLANNNQIEEAKHIFQYLEYQNKLTGTNQKLYKKYFDTVLGARIESENEIQIQQKSLEQKFEQSQFRPPPQGFGGAQGGFMGPPTGGFGGCQGSFAPPCFPNFSQSMQMSVPPPPPPAGGAFGPPPPPGMAFGAPPPPGMPAHFRGGIPLPQGIENVNNNNNNNNNINENTKRRFKDLCQKDDDGSDDEDESNNFRQPLCKTSTTTTSQRYYNEKRSQFIEAFKNVEKTKEYCEKHYSLFISQTNPQTIKLNAFFVDFANFALKKNNGQQEFLSSNFIYCNKNFTEMLAALILLDLPFEAPQQEYKQFGGKGVEIVCQQPALFFMKEIQEGQAQLRNDILISQRFFDPKDRFQISEEDPDLKLEKDIKECLINKIYGCQVIITNCSSIEGDYQILVEIPNGAIPVNTVFYTKSFTIKCSSYASQKIEYYFYFPSIGQYSVYAANVSRMGQVVSVAQETQLSVVEKKTTPNLEAIEDILNNGNKQDILQFIENKNIFNPAIFKPENIYYLLKDKEFYLQVIGIYRKRKFLDYESLKFALYHNDTQSLFELFTFNECQLKLKSHFKYFKCSLFEIINIRMLEYYPLVTKRVHKLVNDAKGILNVEFRNQYTNYLNYLIEKPIHSLSDKLGFIYYLLLQERINEAIQIYETITDFDQEGEPLLQYDYFTAYLDFYIGYPNFTKARQICEKYLNYPIIQWRNLFYEVINLLAEFDGDDDENEKLKTETNQKQKQSEQAKKEEQLETSIEGKNIMIKYSNLCSVTLQFYKIDLEILFTHNPFINKTNQDFTFVIPNFTQEIQLEDQQAGITYKKIVLIPEELQKENLFIQVKGKSKNTINRYFSTTLNVQIMENYGQIRVSDTNNKYLAKVYVKAYVKDKSGKESFYKDGYTDLRGRFDYATLSSTNLQDISKFSLFIASDDLGQIIMEANPPSQVGKYETEVKLVSKNWNQKALFEQQRLENIYEKNKSSK